MLLHFKSPVSAGKVAVRPQRFIVTFEERTLGLRLAQAPFWIVVMMPLQDGTVIYPMVLTINGIPVVKMEILLSMLQDIRRPLHIAFVLPPGAPLLREWAEPTALEFLAGVACGVNNLHTILNTPYQPILPKL